MDGRALWAPWRIDYLRGLTEPEQSPRGSGGRGEGCFLCEAARPDADEGCRREALVLVCDARGVLLLNRFPYANGHLLAAPREHVGELTDLDSSDQHALMDLIDVGCRLLQRAMNPQGINVGMNIGRCAGAGQPGHLHAHVVPRWGGDVNFMQSVAGVRVIPEALEDSYRELREAVQSMDRPLSQTDGGQ